MAVETVTKGSVAPGDVPPENGKPLERTVCVTGANGFIGSWQVAQLLGQGFHVRGTVRNPENEEKNGHLWKLKGAEERLKLFKADVLDYESIYNAVVGCEGVFHTACPVLAEMQDPQKEMIDPAVEGIQNVLEACANAGVRRVIHISTYLNCIYSKGLDSSKVPDETCWADTDFYESLGIWYTVAKVQAERIAWDIAKEKGIELIAMLPAVTFGPMLQKDINVSNQILYGLLMGLNIPHTYIYFGPVDVRDVAASSILLYETPSATGRYLCQEKLEPLSDLAQTVAQLYPQRNIPQLENTQPWLARCSSPSKRMVEEMGFVFRPVSETIADTLSQLQERGLVPKLESEQTTEL